MFLNEQLRRMLSRYVRGQQPMVADENTWLARILVDYYDRDLARELLKEPPPGVNEQEAKSYRTIYGTVDSLDDVFRVMQSHQDAMSQARLVNETTRKILEQFLTGGEDNTPDAVRSFLMSNPNFSNVTKPEFEALVKNISKQVEETYRNRARTIARTELAIAQSKTVAQELRAQGKTHVRIYDGLGCGWRHHDDGDYANGSLRRIEDYLNYPVAHPNCVRAGYPDFFGGDGSIHVGKKDLDLFGVELKYNPNHDRLGRFSSGSGVPGNFVGLEDLDSMLSGIGLEADQEKLGRVLDSVHDLNEFYPKTAGSVVFTFRGPGDRVLTDDHHVSLAHYSRSGLDGKPTIFIDGRLVSKDEGLLKGDLEVRAFTSAHLSKAQEVGFHPKTKDPVTQIVNHEFAHHMAETARQESISGKAEAWTNIRWASYNTQPGRISTYAKTGWDEAWAEGFSYVHELGPKKMKQTAFTKNIWRAIESYDRTIEGR